MQPTTSITDYIYSFLQLGNQKVDKNLIEQMVANNSDVAARLYDILKFKTTSNEEVWRKCRDITYFLSIAASHEKRDEPRKEMRRIVQIAEELLGNAADKNQPPWKGLLEAIEAEISEKSKPLHYPLGPSKAISPSSFAHIHAESFIAHTEFEGHAMEPMIEQFLQYLPKNPKEEELQNLQKWFQECRELIQKFDLDRYKTPEEIHKIKEPFSKHILEKVEQLKVGEGILLPAGWAGKPTGHTMLLLLIKQKDGSLKALVFNSGAGLRYHVSLYSQNILKYLPYMQITQVVPGGINENFLTALLEMNTVVYGSAPTEYNAKDAYEKLFSTLGKTEMDPSALEEDFSPLALAGVCSWGAILGVARFALGSKSFDRLNFEIKLQSLVDFVNQFKQDLLKNPELLNLADKGCEQFARDVLGFYKRGIISQQELAEIHAELKAILTQIYGIRRSAALHFSERQQIFLKELEKKEDFKKVEITLPEQEFYHKSTQTSFKAAPVVEVYSQFQGLDKTENFLQEIIQFRNWCEKMKTESRQTLLQSIIQFYAELPGPSRDFWKKIPQEQVVACMVEIAQIGEIANKFGLYQRNYQVPMQVGMVKGLTILWELSKRLDSLKSFHQKGSKQSCLPMDIFLGYLVGTFWAGRPFEDKNLYHLELRKQLGEIVEYLKMINPKDPFYGDERRYAFSFAELERGEDILHYFDGNPSSSFESEFITDNLSKSEVQSKIAQVRPDLARESLHKQREFAIADLSGEVLPPEFCALKKQAILAANNLCEAVSDLWESKETSRLKFHKNNISGSSHAVGINHHGYNHQRNRYDGDNYGNLTYGNLTDPLLLHLVHISRTFDSSLRRYFSEESAKFENDYHHKYIQKLAKDSIVSPEEVPALLALMTGGDLDGEDPHWEMQASKTLAYFTANRGKMAVPEFQTFFRLLVFESNYLETLLSHNPEFALILADFVKKGFEFFGDRGDITTQAFYIEISRYFEKIVRAQGIMAGSFPDPFELFRKMVAKPDLTSVERHVLYKHLKGSYATHGSKELSTEQIFELLEGTFYTYMHPCSASFSETLKFENATLFNKYNSQIKALIQGPQGNSLLTKLALKLGVKEPLLESWNTENYPLCKISDKIVLNVAQGEIFHSGLRLTALPSDILEHEDYKAVFKRNDFLAQSSAFTVYEFRDEQGVKTRITKERAIKIEKELEPGRWYTYIKADLNFPFLKDKLLWQSDWQNGKGLIKAGDLKIRLVRKPLTQKTEIEGVERIYQGNTLHLTNGEGSTGIFPGKTLFIWKNKEGVPVLLEDPKTGLEFSLEQNSRGNWIAHSENFPEYILSHNQNIKNLPGFTGGWVLENQKGDRKLATPQSEIFPLKDGSLDPQFFFWSNEKKELELWDIDPKKGVVPANREQQLSLACFHFARKEYFLAQELIRKSASKVLPYQKKEKELLMKLVNLQEQMKDSDPKASGVALTALTQLVSDNPQFLKESDFSFCKKVDQLISHYLRQEISARSLTPDEREILFSALISSSAKLETDPIQLSLLGGRELNFSTDIMQPSIEQEKRSDDYIDHIDFMGICRSVFETANQDPYPLLTRPRKAFLNQNLESLYKGIREKNPGARLQLNFAHQQGEMNRHLLYLLEKVWENPDKFPDETEFMAIVFQGDYPSFKKLFVNQFGNEKKEKEVGTKKQMGRIISFENTSQTQKTPFPLQPVKKLPPILKEAQKKSYFCDVPYGGIKLSEKEIQELQDAVDLGEKTPFSQKRAEELKQDIQRAWENPPETSPFLDPNKIEHLKIRLKVMQAEEAKLHLREIQQLLAKANAIKGVAQGVELQGKLRQAVTFHDICLSLIDHNGQRLREKNPTLSDGEIQTILNETLNVVESGKRLHKITRILEDDIEMLSKRAQEIESADRDPFYLHGCKKLLDNLTRPSAYQIHKHPEFSLFEYIAHVQLYQTQADDVSLMANAPGDQILQKIMGSGKSKIYLPLLALLKADGNRLPVIVVATSQYDTILRDMEGSSGQIFEQTTHTFKFSRETPCTVENLQKIQEDFEEIIAKRHYLVVTDTTLHCMHNRCKEMVLGYLRQCHKIFSENPKASFPPVPPELQEMRKLLALVKEGILDEAHLLLNSRHEVNFTQGKPIPIDSSHARMVKEVYRCIYENPELRAMIEPVVSQEHFKRFVRPRMAEALFDFAKESFGDLDRELVIDYWLNGDKGDWYVADLKDFHIQDLLAIVKEELNELLPLTLSKPIDFRYGRSSNPRELLAVPYVGNMRPSPTSRFGNPYELLNYTTQAFLKQGVSPDVLKTLVENLKQQALQEIAKDPSRTVKETGAYKQFFALSGDANMNLMRVSQQEIEKIAERFKNDKNALFNFLEQYVYPLVTIHPEKLTSHHLTLVDQLSNEAQGFAGTPYNQVLYHSRLKTLQEVGSDGKTLGILKKNSSDKIHNLASNEFTNVLDHLLGGMDTASPYRTLKDAGAIFNGVENRFVAEEILKRVPKNIKGVKFYDQDNCLYVLERGKGVPVPANQSNLKPEETFTYYDQWNTTGKDIKQMAHARGFVTIGKLLTTHELAQAVWRLRDLDKNQIAELVVIPEVAELICKELNLPKERMIDFDLLLKFVEFNEKRELETQLPGNVLQKMGHVTENEVWKILVNPDTDLSKAVPATPQIEPLLCKTQVDRPYLNFGKKEESVATTQVLSEKMELESNVIRELGERAPLFQQLDAKDLRGKMEKALRKEILPETMFRPIRLNREQTVEIEQEMEKEQEVEVEHLKEMETELESQSRDRHPFNHWNWTGADREMTPTSRGFFAPCTFDEVMDRRHSPSINPYTHFFVSTGLPPVLTLKEIFSHTKGLETYQDVFQIEATSNFLPINTGFWCSEGKERAIPFEEKQLDVHHYLILHDRKSHEKRLLLISAGDAGYFYTKLAEEKKKGERDVDILLGEIHLGVLQSTHPDLVKMHGEKDTLALITQGKFYNGELHYTAAEQSYLRQWFQEKGSERMERLFYQEILKYKPAQRKFFPNSTIGRLFNKKAK